MSPLRSEPAAPCPRCGQGVRYTPHSACPFCKTVLRPIEDPRTGKIIRWVVGNRFRS